MKLRHIYIISDIHLGGAPPEKTPQGETTGFQMCPPEARSRLARFIHYISKSHPQETTELVINGDFVDFLAEEAENTGTTHSVSVDKQFESFTTNPDNAVKKFRRIVQHTDGGAPSGERVFGALRDFVSQGHSLTVLLGNHDIELSIPDVRYALMGELAQGRPAFVKFLYDGEAYVREDLLVEHGNRYDGWNAVAHGVLRAYRSAVSRSEDPVQFIPPPGSRMVTEIMNPLKAHFKFIDLLKPENEALIPVLAALNPQNIQPLRKIIRALPLFAEKIVRQPKAGGVPKNPMYIADNQDVTVKSTQDFFSFVYGDLIDQKTINKSKRLLAQAIKNWNADVEKEPMHIANIHPGIKEKVSGAMALFGQNFPFSHPTYEKLRKALLSYRQALGSTFDLETESPIYSKAAARLAAGRRGRRTVVFGHTHLPKCIKLETGGVYLNAGTWCQTIRLPTDFYTPSQSEQSENVILTDVKKFIDDLAQNRIKDWCTLRTTFVKVTQGGQTSAELLEFRENGSIALARATNA